MESWIKIVEKVKLKNPLLIEGLPGIGNVGKVAVDFIIDNIKAKKILMLYGSQEARSLIKRVKETFEQIDSKQKHLVSIRKTEHEIGNKRYIESIHLAAKNFL